MRERKAHALDDILEEVARATSKFPTWPRDPLHALAILGEEFGELTKAVLQGIYDADKSPQAVRLEAIQTAAMALRFIASIDAYDYVYAPAPQCVQRPETLLPSFIGPLLQPNREQP